MRIVRMPISKNYDWNGLRPYMTTDNNGEPEENCPFCGEVSKENKTVPRTKPGKKLKAILKSK